MEIVFHLNPRKRILFKVDRLLLSSFELNFYQQLLDFFFETKKHLKQFPFSNFPFNIKKGLLKGYKKKRGTSL